MASRKNYGRVGGDVAQNLCFRSGPHERHRLVQGRGNHVDGGPVLSGGADLLLGGSVEVLLAGHGPLIRSQCWVD